MLVHIVLGSVPGRIQNRNRFGLCGCSRGAAHQAHDMSQPPRRVRIMKNGSPRCVSRLAAVRQPSSGDCGAGRTRTGVSPRTTLSNRDQQGVPVLLKLLPVDLSDDKAGSD